MKTLRLHTANKERMQQTIQKGDKVGAVAFHKKSGFTGIFEIRSAHHWGVYAIMRGTEVDYYCKNYKESFREEINKRQFLIKWKHVSHIELK